MRTYSPGWNSLVLTVDFARFFMFILVLVFGLSEMQISTVLDGIRTTYGLRRYGLINLLNLRLFMIQWQSGTCGLIGPKQVVIINETLCEARTPGRTSQPCGALPWAKASHSNA